MNGLVKGLLLGGAVLALASCSSTGDMMSSTHNHHQDGVARGEFPHVLGAAQYKTRTWFATNKANINAAGKRSLDQIVTTYKQLMASGSISANTPITVVGHTDSRASVSYNQGLSERRAMAVAQYLKSKGVNAVVTRGVSELQPIASNRTRRGMQMNRRAEIHIGGGYIRVVAW